MTDTTGNTSYDSVKTGSDDEYCKKVLTLKKSPAKCGMYTFNDGSRYIGDFDNDGVKCGKGHMEAPNGSTYEGQFQKGLPNGLGVMRFPDSSRYEGEFMQGWFHGHGIYTTIDGTKFEGEFRGGRLWGKGLLSYSDGSPGTEGYFQDVRFSRECSAVEDIKKARKVAAMARSFCETMEM
eukprot:15136.XXX_1087108_1086333_1 [CDS] Oithona nana genome sequencing.